MLIRLIVFGVAGWCMEILWTGFGSLVKGDYKLTANTSVWMFFIYGMGAFFTPVIDMLLGLPILVRGGVYVLFIFLAEFISGFLMTRFNACPWDYSGAKYNVMGIIRLDYAPAWFAAGLAFEYIHLALAAIL